MRPASPRSSAARRAARIVVPANLTNVAKVFRLVLPLQRATALIVAVIALAACSSRAEVRASHPAPPPTYAKAALPRDGPPPLEATAWTSPDLSSPDGSSIAWDAGDRTQSAVYIRHGGGKPRVLLAADVPLYVAAWWPNSGGLLVYRTMGFCVSCNVDGVTLVAVPLRGPAMEIAPVIGGAGGYSWSPQEKLLVGSVHSRFVYDGDPTVYVCDVQDRGCRSIAKPRSTADLTPAWSPDGRRIAFARGPLVALPSGIPFLPAIASWQESLTVWVADADGGNQRQVTSGPASGYPAWSADGRQLTFVRGGALWSLDLASGAERRLTGPLIGRRGYGWTDWSGAGAARNETSR